MIFQYILDSEINPQHTFLLSLFDHVALSPRQFCILADWKVSHLRVIIHRIRQIALKKERKQWIQCNPTPYGLDHYYYSLGSKGLKFCGRLLNKRFSQIDDPIAQNTHILGLNEILVRLIEAGVDRQKVIWLATKEATDYLYRIFRLLDPSVNKREMIRPDARLVLGQHTFWIEYDNATEGALELENKLDRYIHTLEPLSKEWIDPMGKVRPKIDHSPVIWVAKNEERKRYLENIWRGLVGLRYQGVWVPQMYFFASGKETAFILEH